MFSKRPTRPNMTVCPRETTLFSILEKKKYNEIDVRIPIRLVRLRFVSDGRYAGGEDIVFRRISRVSFFDRARLCLFFVFRIFSVFIESAKTSSPAYGRTAETDRVESHRDLRSHARSRVRDLTIRVASTSNLFARLGGRRARRLN